MMDIVFLVFLFALACLVWMWFANNITLARRLRKIDETMAENLKRIRAGKYDDLIYHNDMESYSATLWRTFFTLGMK